MKAIVANKLHMKHIASSCVDLEIKEGKITMITGENGCGKSTLAAYLAGMFIPENDGKVTIHGMDTSVDANYAKIRKTCGIVFQELPENQIFDNGSDEMSFGIDNLQLFQQACEKNVYLRKLLQAFDISEQKSVHTMSGGEQQRLCIANIVAMRPSILIMDESLSMQDTSHIEAIMRYLREWCDKEQGTVVMITQDPKVIHYGDEVYQLKDGKITLVDVLKNRGSGLSNNSSSMDSISTYMSSSLKDGKQHAKTTELGTMRCHATCISADETMKRSKLIMRQVSFSYKENVLTENAFKEYERKDNTLKDNTLGEKGLFQNLSMEFETGYIYTISGTTGSGKTTLGKLLHGMLKPETGAISVAIEGDEELLTCNAVVSRQKVSFRQKKQEKRAIKQFRQHVGYVMQSPEKQLFAETVLEDILYGLNMDPNCRMTDEEKKALVKERIHCLGLSDDILNKDPTVLSGGEKRLVAIAGSMIKEPTFFILDEPEAGLDAEHRDKLRNMLLQYARGNHGVIVLDHM